MHQPYYRDDKNAQTLMPWVFLHAIKDYYDIPWYAQDFKKVKATYNLVPSLIYQIKSYINNSANDKLLEAIKKHTHELNGNDISFLQSYLFLSNEKNMIKPLERYYELYLKYKTNNSIKGFDTQEILDTQVLFLLSWCGNFLRTNNETVKKLLEKEHYYTHGDKLALIETLIEFLPQILEYYEKLDKEGKITLCTTPYYHPITPLLLDINSAREAKPDVTLPEVKESFESFGIANTKNAMEYFKNVFHKTPSGFWPAEGSVSLKTAKLFLNNDLKWFCTDEEILFKTLKDHNKQNIYKNYKLHIDGKSIDVRFRDHYLSDAIGFEYSQKDPKHSAHEFVEHLKKIYDHCDFSPLVNIILDGENAWEFFPNNAQDFFNELYSLFEKTPWLECVTMDEISSLSHIQHSDIHHLESGSWINGNFDIWIGSQEKNKAWELLDLAKKDYETNKEHLNQEVKELIEKEFMIALGSDWFWWYGDDHYTVLAKEFDELFRKHLINIYELMNREVPSKILMPIIKDDKIQSFHKPPVNYISPKCDGKKSDYFEWLGCGVIDISKEFSVMDGSKNVISKVLYGFDENDISFFFEGKNLKNYNLIFDLNDEHFIIDNINNADKNFDVFCTDNSLEIKVPKNLINNKDTIKFKFQLKKDEKNIQTFPIYNDFFIAVENIELKNWYV